MTITNIILAPFITFKNISLSIVQFIYDIIDNSFIIPLLYIGRIALYGISIPIWPIVYLFEFDSIRVPLIYDFFINLMHFIIVGGIFGVIIGLILSQNLLLFQYLIKFEKPKEISNYPAATKRPVSSGKSPSSGKSVKIVEHEIKPVPASLARIKTESGSEVEITPRSKLRPSFASPDSSRSNSFIQNLVVYEDDDGYYPKSYDVPEGLQVEDNTETEIENTTNDSLFEKYLQDTRLSSIVEDEKDL